MGKLHVLFNTGLCILLLLLFQAGCAGIGTDGTPNLDEEGDSTIPSLDNSKGFYTMDDVLELYATAASAEEYERALKLSVDFTDQWALTKTQQDKLFPALAEVEAACTQLSTVADWYQAYKGAGFAIRYGASASEPVELNGTELAGFFNNLVQACMSEPDSSSANLVRFIFCDLQNSVTTIPTITPATALRPAQFLLLLQVMAQMGTGADASGSSVSTAKAQSATADEDETPPMDLAQHWQEDVLSTLQDGIWDLIGSAGAIGAMVVGAVDLVSGVQEIYYLQQNLDWFGDYAYQQAVTDSSVSAQWSTGPLESESNPVNVTVACVFDEAALYFAHYSYAHEYTLRYEVSYGDGTQDEGTFQESDNQYTPGFTRSHTYHAPSGWFKYKVNAKVIAEPNGVGKITEWKMPQQEVKVGRKSNAGPSAEMTLTPLFIGGKTEYRLLRVDGSASSDDDKIVRYVFEFIDPHGRTRKLATESDTITFGFEQAWHGNVTVKLTVYDANEIPAVVSSTYYVPEWPKADLKARVTGGNSWSGSSVTGNSPLTVEFSAADTTGEKPFKYYFDLDGNGKYEVGPQTSPAAQLKYYSVATLQAKVKVVDAYQQEAGDAVSVSVLEQPLKVGEIQGPAAIEEGKSAEYTLTVDAQAGKQKSYAWNLSPSSVGSLSSTTAAQTTFTANDLANTTTATLKVTVTVEGSSPVTKTKSISVTVTPVPLNVSSISGPTSLDEAESATYSVSASGASGIGYNWSVSPASAGSFSSKTSASTVFTAAGVSSNVSATISVYVSAPSATPVTKSVGITIINAGDQTMSDGTMQPINGSGVRANIDVNPNQGSYGTEVTITIDFTSGADEVAYIEVYSFDEAFGWDNAWYESDAVAALGQTDSNTWFADDLIYSSNEPVVFRFYAITWEGEYVAVGDIDKNGGGPAVSWNSDGVGD